MSRPRRWSIGTIANLGLGTKVFGHMKQSFFVYVLCFVFNLDIVGYGLDWGSESPGWTTNRCEKDLFLRSGFGFDGPGARSSWHLPDLARSGHFGLSLSEEQQATTTNNEQAANNPTHPAKREHQANPATQPSPANNPTNSIPNDSQFLQPHATTPVCPTTSTLSNPITMHTFAQHDL